MTPEQPKGDALHALLNEIKSRAEYATKPTAITGSVRAELSAFIDKLEATIPAHDAQVREEGRKLERVDCERQVRTIALTDGAWIDRLRADAVREYEETIPHHRLCPAQIKIAPCNCGKDERVARLKP